MKDGMKYLLVLFLIIGSINSTYINQFQPLQIHLSLTDKQDEMIITWLTRSKIPHPTIYYYIGECKDLKGDDEESLPSLLNSTYNLKISSGYSKSYYSYDGYVHHVTLTPLQTSQTYCYSLGGDIIRNITNNSYKRDQQNSNNNINDESNNIQNDYSTSWSKWNSFKTERSRGESSTFAAIADSGTYGNVFDVVKVLSKDKDVGMLIHGGDLSYGKVEEKWDLFGEIFELVTSKIPMMVIPGNWDVKEGASLPFYNRYKMPLHNPTPSTFYSAVDKNLQTHFNYYYSFKFSYAYIIMLSAYDPYHSTSPQYEWFEKELITANSQRDKYPWLIVSVHSPMYSTSSGHNGSDLAFRDQVEDLFKRYQVNLVLSGHDHGYERTFPVLDGEILSKNLENYTTSQGTIHIVVGTGGADCDPWLQSEDWSAHRESTSGYTKITTHRNSLEITYIRINETIGDHLVIQSSLSTYTPSHKSVLIVFFILLTVVFPICAYNRLPSKIFSIFLSPTYTKTV